MVQGVVDKFVSHGKMTEALSLCQRTLSRCSDGECIKIIGDIFIVLGAQREAIAAYVEAAKHGSNKNGRLRDIAGILLSLEQGQEAFEVYKKIFADHSDDRRAYQGLGDGLAALGKHQEALEAYDKAVEGDARDARSHKIRGGHSGGSGSQSGGAHSL